MLTECGNLPTPELLEQTRHELGLDQPFLVQYGNWVKGVLTGDMGTSYAFKVPVTEKLMKCFWPTLKMSLFALLLMILFSIPCGILSAVYQNKWPDYLIRGITFFGVSIPSFWIGLILLGIFGVQLRWINVAGGTTDFKAMILPSVTLALSMSAKYTRQVRNAVLEELRQDYVIGARMRGIKESAILWKHVLPNAMLPIVTLLGLSLGSLLGGTAVVEIIHNWPGMGSMAIKAISCRDYPMVQAYVLMIAIMYMVINIIVDISYTYLDPRIKEAWNKAVSMLTKMRLPDAENIMNSYPYQLSGGMRQRVGIAMAMTFNPELLLADEPTSALDVTTQAQIVRQMMELRDDFGTGIIIVTHNIGVAAYMADQLIVMHHGKVVDHGTREEVLSNPTSDYTKKLLEAVPEMEGKRYV